MMARFLVFVVLFMFATPSYAVALELVENNNERLDLRWSDLLPPGEAERIAKLYQVQAVQTGFNHFGNERMPQIQTFNVVEDLNGKFVKISGFVLPISFTGTREVDEFLLVPYQGACIHVPSPPPNQLVYVTSKTPIKIRGIWDPVFIEGIIYTRRKDSVIANTAYNIELSKLTNYKH